MSFEFFVSLRYLKAKRKQTFISIITFISIGGVALGVTALIVVLAVMSGFENDLKNKILGLNAHVLVLSWDNQVAHYAQLAGQVEKVPGVTGATPFILTQVLLNTPQKVTGAVLRGLEVDSARRVIILDRIIRTGSWKALEAPAGDQPECRRVFAGDHSGAGISQTVGPVFRRSGFGGLPPGGGLAVGPGPQNEALPAGRDL